MNTAAKIKMVSDLIGHVNTNYNTDEILSVFKNLADYTVEDSTAYPQVFYGGKVDGAWVEVPTTLADMATGVHQFLEGDIGYSPRDVYKRQVQTFDYLQRWRPYAPAFS